QRFSVYRGAAGLAAGSTGKSAGRSRQECLRHDQQADGLRLQPHCTLVLLVLLSLSACSTPKAAISPNPVLPKNLRLPGAAEAGRIPPPIHPEGVTRVQDTLAALERFNLAGRNRNLEQVYFELPESDINQYLAYSLNITPRPGIESASVKLRDRNRISASLVL